jgi:rhamnogalacturonan II specific xylosyltransferase
MLDALISQTPDPSKKRLVVSAFNYGYADFVDNFANSLLQQNVRNFVLVPLDVDAYISLRKVYPEHVLPVMSFFETGVSKNANFGTDDFKKITSSRPTFLIPFLEKGYTIYYNDVDMVWQQDAWTELDLLDADYKNAVDAVTQETFSTPIMWQDSPSRVLCSCMLYLPPIRHSLELLSRWEAKILSNEYKNDQSAFNVAEIRNHFNGTAVRVNSQNEAFPSAKTYFADKTKAVVVHNNWIIGKEKKLNRFKQYKLWKPSGLLPVTPTRMLRFSPWP